MLATVFRQDYSNFKIIYIDDGSRTPVPEKTKKYLKQQTKLKSINVTAIFNKDFKYALENRHISIVDHCQEDDIVIDIDADDSLIGSQVFKLVNALYQKNP